MHGLLGEIYFEWICIFGTEKLLRDTRNFETSKLEIRGKIKLKSTKFKTGLQKNFDLVKISSKLSLTYGDSTG
jgi:hypothetical protein